MQVVTSGELSVVKDLHNLVLTLFANNWVVLELIDLVQQLI